MVENKGAIESSIANGEALNPQRPEMSKSRR
jgi:hypothetical protein